MPIKKEVKERVKERIIELSEDLQKNAELISRSMGKFCISINLELSGFAPDEYPQWKVSFLHASETFIDKWKWNPKKKGK